MPASISALLTRLNVKARDGSDITFSAAEKTEALTTAFADAYVVDIVRDATLTTSSNVDHYTVPSALTTVMKVGLQLNTYGKPSDVDGWDVYGGVLYFDSLPLSGKTVVLVGTYKTTTSDNVSDDRVEYVLTLAKLELVKYLQSSLSQQFLTNDMTMGDLLQLEGNLAREAEAWRTKFSTQVIDL